MNHDAKSQKKIPKRMTERQPYQRDLEDLWSQMSWNEIILQKWRQFVFKQWSWINWRNIDISLYLKLRHLILWQSTYFLLIPQSFNRLV